MRVGLGVVVGMVLGTGCPESVDCTTEARSSVSLTVVDEDGAPIPGATATYAVDGAAAEPCEPVGDGFVCGWEVAGDFEITASAGGYEDASEQLTVTADECHVQSEVLELVLEPIQSAG